MIGALAEYATPTTPRQADCGLRRHRHLIPRSIRRASMLHLLDDQSRKETRALLEDFRALDSDFFDYLRALYRR